MQGEERKLPFSDISQAGREPLEREGQKQTCICNAEAFLKLPVLGGRLLLRQRWVTGAVLLQSLEMRKGAMMVQAPADQPWFCLERQPGLDLRYTERGDRDGYLSREDA